MRRVQGVVAIETGSIGQLIMAPGGVLEGYVAQDRRTGVFYDVNVLPVRSLRHAARADSLQTVHDTMSFAILEGRVECPDGYEVHRLFDIGEGF